MLVKGALVVLLVAALAFVALAAEEKKIKCYSCATESVTDDKCKTPDKDTKTEECTECYYVNGKKDDKDTWKRGCVSDTETCEKLKETWKEPSYKEVSCGTCKKEKCIKKEDEPSSASSITSSLVLTAVAAMLLKVNY